ncbi:hypothetical protein [Bacillus sp. AG4(2022)]|uniref:hypothetical protein n=1 Tax=Bacillus sp. AG4(2022) TaxID=2962594 RepID=UPI002880E512|nr:hypothetical protein [Bacillus sp. AG4(2022)]MDT0163852.1 hypothetical protein [Bacillus sp. AG4(2022)]
MDIKTLQYMEERAGKARKIVNQIEVLTNKVASIKKSKGVIDLYTPQRAVRIEIQQSSERAQDNYETQLVASVYNTYINITLAEIRNLERELAEL